MKTANGGITLQMVDGTKCVLKIRSERKVKMI